VAKDSYLKFHIQKEAPSSAFPRRHLTNPLFPNHSASSQKSRTLRLYQCLGAGLRAYRSSSCNGFAALRTRIEFAGATLLASEALPALGVLRGAPRLRRSLASATRPARHPQVDARPRRGLSRHPDAVAGQQVVRVAVDQLRRERAAPAQLLEVPRDGSSADGVSLTTICATSSGSGCSRVDARARPPLTYP
jgi:hypothetical protein